MYSIVNKKRLSFDYGLAIIIRKMNIAVNEKKFLLPQTYCVTKHFLGSLCLDEIRISNHIYHLGY